MIRDATIRPVISGVEPPLRMQTSWCSMTSRRFCARATAAGSSRCRHRSAGMVLGGVLRRRSPASPARPDLFWPPLAWTLLGVVRPTLHAADGLVGGISRTGMERTARISAARPPTIGRRNAPALDGVPPERFSVRWTGFLTVGRSGLYTFATTSDDGSQLIVDNQLVVDNSGPHSLRTRSGSIRLDRGSYAVVLRYVQFGAASALDWSWSRDGSAYAPVPAWALSQRRTTLRDCAQRPDRRVGTLELRDRDGAGCGVVPARWPERRGDGPVGGGPPPGSNGVASQHGISGFLGLDYCRDPIHALGGRRRQYPFYSSVEGTIRDLNGTAFTMLRRFDAFQADINNPQSDESILPIRVQEMLTMLRGHGVERYRVSESIAELLGVSADRGVGLAAQAREKAKAEFVLNGEPVMPSCQLIDKQREVSLVYCP